jgi:hypothetical protein
VEGLVEAFDLNYLVNDICIMAQYSGWGNPYIYGSLMFFMLISSKPIGQDASGLVNYIGSPGIVSKKLALAWLGRLGYSLT